MAAKENRLDVQPSADPVQALREAASASTSEERQFVEWLLETIDFSSYSQIQEHHLRVWRDPTRYPAKYLDIAYWTLRRFALARTLALDTRERGAILDIGCGPGNLGLAARYFGHRYLGMDIPGNPVFGDLSDLFGVARHIGGVRPQAPLSPTLGTFDLVTAISANFYRRPSGELFSRDDWIFFMTDLVDNHVSPGGSIYFTLNPLRGDAGLHYWDDEFVSLIEERGGEVDRRTGHVVFSDLAGWRS